MNADNYKLAQQATSYMMTTYLRQRRSDLLKGGPRDDRDWSITGMPAPVPHTIMWQEVACERYGISMQERSATKLSAIQVRKLLQIPYAHNQSNAPGQECPQPRNGCKRSFSNTCSEHATCAK